MRSRLKCDICNLCWRDGRVNDATDLDTAGLAVVPNAHFANRPAQRGVKHHPVGHINADMGHVATKDRQRFGAQELACLQHKTGWPRMPMNHHYVASGPVRKVGTESARPGCRNG